MVQNNVLPSAPYACTYAQPCIVRVPDSAGARYVQLLYRWTTRHPCHLVIDQTATRYVLPLRLRAQRKTSPLLRGDRHATKGELFQRHPPRARGLMQFRNVAERSPTSFCPRFLWTITDTFIPSALSGLHLRLLRGLFPSGDHKSPIFKGKLRVLAQTPPPPSNPKILNY